MKISLIKIYKNMFFADIPKNYWYLIIIAVLIVVVAIAGVFIITKIVKERVNINF